MANTLLRIGLYFIGLAGSLIGLSFFFLGVDFTAQLFNSILSVVHDTGPVNDLGTPNAESELRFYSVFWIAYGVILIQTAGSLTKHRGRVPLLLALFFLGGVGRAISCFANGTPHALFVLLMVIELTLPVLLFFCFRLSKRNQAD